MTIRRSWAVYAGAGLALVAASYATRSQAIIGWVYVATGLAAAVALIARAPSAGRRAGSWRMLGVGVGLFTIGDVAWNTYQFILREEPPFPSWADLAYLLGYVALSVGVASLALRRADADTRRAFADGLIVALGGLVLSWELLIAPYWLDASTPLLTRAVSAAYPVMDVVLLGVFVGFLFAGRRSSASYWFVVGASTLNLLGDAVYSIQTLEGTYVSGGLLDLTWMLSYLCWGVAVLHPSMRTVGDRTIEAGAPVDHRPRILLLGAAAGAGPLVVLMGGALHVHDVHVIAAISLAIFLVTLLRMSGLMRDLSAKVVELRRQQQITRAAVVEQQRSADEVRRQEARFRSLVANMSDVICLLDPHGNVSYTSPAVEQVLGYTQSEMVGQSILRYAHPEDVDAAAESLARVVQGDRVHTELRALHKDGSPRWIEVTADNHLDDPDLQAIVSVYRDVTQRKALEEQLMQSQKLEAIGQLAGGVAHDFNNILAVISNYATFLLEELPPGDAKREDADEIRKASQRASNLVRQLLTFSRREIISPRVLDVNAVLFDLQKLLRRTLPESIRLSVKLTSEQCLTEADPSQIEQILMNLCVNSRDAMPHGGEIEIITNLKKLFADEGMPSGTRAGAYVELTVCDTGVGMTEDVRRHVFEPFYTTKRRGEGTGLGLATVYGIVQRLSGHIDIESTPGRGTSIHVLLPLSAQDAESADDASATAPTVCGGESILVAEDEAAVRGLVERILGREGYDVVVAASGEEALRIAETRDDIELLLTDVVMPQMSGRELAMRLQDRVGPTRVVFMSGYTDDIIARHGVLGEGEVLIQKPFTARELTAIVRETLDTPASPRTAPNAPSPAAAASTAR